MDQANVYVIAEAGVNHNGSVSLAKELIDCAVEARANAVKFQTFKAERVVSHFAPKAPYQKLRCGEEETQLEMLKKLELSHEAHFELFSYCKAKDIEFLSTPFDDESLHFLARSVKVARLKIPSGEAVTAPLLLQAARTGLPLIVSTGMSDLSEVEDILGVLAYGYVYDADAVPSKVKFQEAYRQVGCDTGFSQRITLLHCTSAYPTPFQEVNLYAMDTLRDRFRLQVGLSDHTPGIAVSIAAVARGAKVIEKHFTLDKKLPGPDHQASLEPHELKQLVQSIREVEQALGDGTKRPTPSETVNLAAARKSLVASCAIKAGDVFTEKNVTCKRPGTGLSPFHYWELLGKKAGRAYAPDELITGFITSRDE